MMFYFSTCSHEFFFTTHADLYCLLEYVVTMIKSKNYVTCDIIEFVKEMHSSITSINDFGLKVKGRASVFDVFDH